MSAAHTPAPWAVRDVPGHASDIVTEDGMYVAYVAQVYGHKNTGGPMTANARLIAAAPELLAALQALLQDVGPANSLLGAIKARAAIAKATGAAS